MRLILLLSPILLLSASCKEYKPAEPTFFLIPSEIRVNTDPKHGSSSHKITDLWVYVNGQFQGCYPADARFPVISKNSSARVQIFAGIKNNGIKELRIPYPFYSFLQLDTLVESGKNVSRAFTFRYSATTNFTWMENFDSSIGISIRRSAISDTTYRFADLSQCFEGRSVELGLNNSGLIAQIESSGPGFELPRYSSNVYLELNYKGNTMFEVGVIDDDQKHRPALHINPQQEWSKIYVQLSEAVSMEPESGRFRVYFRVQNTAGITEPRIFLDNIKLVYFT